MTSGSDDALATHELDLVTRAAQGDADAFDRFYERNATGVQLLVERLLGPGAVADTVVIETFEKTVRRLPLLGARNSSPRLYLLTTARNGAYAALGRDRPTPESPAVTALLALPSRQRELLALRELGLSEAECAEVAGIEAPEVGVQIARGRLRLTDALEDASLTGVFAEPRAERLLAAEVVRQEGVSLAAELEQEITQLADSDARFAAALAAVRSPSRSVGQLPPATGASRLAPIARERSVHGTGSTSRTAAAATSVTPRAPEAPAAPSDPYDADIGDEAAWGIVDDDEFAATPPSAGRPTGEPAGDSAWESGTPEPADEPAASSGAAAGADDDPLAGWDDALDWPDDDRQWSAGDASDADDDAQDAPASATGASPEPTDPDATRAFDVVGAGLADAGDDEPTQLVSAPEPLDGEDRETFGEERRSPWRFLLWVIGFALLFAGVAFAAYTYQQAKDSPAPPASSLEPATSTDARERDAARNTPTPTPKRSPRATPKAGAESSSKNAGASKRSGSTSGSSAASGTGSGSTGSSGSSASNGASSSGGTTTGQSKSSDATRSTGTSGGTTSGGADDDRTVSGGESTSGGAVRGSGTTP